MQDTEFLSTSRRRFLAMGAAALAVGAVPGGRVLRAAEEKAPVAPAPVSGPFELPPLPYAYDALAPHIDGATMKLHHGKHHAAYVTKLNEALEKAPDLKSRKIEEILADTKGIPSEVRKAIRNNGGGHFNHSLFWKLMGPGGSGEPEGDLAAAIDKAFGSFDAFKTAFAKEASGVFGSGWAWLIVGGDGKLEITSTPNQDSPIMDVAETKGKIVLGIDVWEHAYYLNYKNVRADYIKAWWNVVNWKTAGEMFSSAKS